MVVGLRLLYYLFRIGCFREDVAYPREIVSFTGGVLFPFVLGARRRDRDQVVGLMPPIRACTWEV